MHARKTREMSTGVHVDGYVHARIGSFRSMTRSKLRSEQLKKALVDRGIDLKRLKALLKERGHDPAFARRIFIAESKTEPELESLRKIAETLGSTAAEMFPDEGEPKPPEIDPELQVALKALRDLPQAMREVVEFARFKAS